MKIVTLNIRQGGGGRMSALLGYIKSLTADVVVLTEFREKCEEVLRSELALEGLIHFSSPSVSPTQNSVCIFSRLPFKSRTYPELSQGDLGRVISAHFEKMTIFGVYFALGKDKESLFRFFLDGDFHPADPEVMVIGDFNTGLQDLDRGNGTKFHCVNLFEDLPSAGLIDSWRSRNPEERAYSWYSNANNGFRLDHVFSNPSADNKILDVYYDHTPRESGITDHSAMMVEYSN